MIGCLQWVPRLLLHFRQVAQTSEVAAVQGGDRCSDLVPFLIIFFSSVLQSQLCVHFLCELLYFEFFVAPL